MLDFSRTQIFVVWVFIKIVLILKFSKLESIKSTVRITYAVSAVTRKILTNVWADIDHRVDVCVATIMMAILKFFNYVNKTLEN